MTCNRSQVQVRSFAARFLGSITLGLLAVPAYAQEPAAGEPIKIGVIAALSGPLVGYGKSVFDGVKMAIDQANAQGGVVVKGVRHPVQLVERDNRSDVNASVAAATSLVRDNGIKFIIGPATGFEIASAVEITQRAKVIRSSALKGGTPLPGGGMMSPV